MNGVFYVSSIFFSQILIVILQPLQLPHVNTVLKSVDLELLSEWSEGLATFITVHNLSVHL